LIGNSDRHQENWAIINVNTLISEDVTQVEKGLPKGEIDKKPNRLNKILKALHTLGGDIRSELEKARLMLRKQTRFAPIYDNGCSFGRELDDGRVTQMLNNEQEIQKYIANGLAEIHWGNS